jgi:hypothetical protein
MTPRPEDAPAAIAATPAALRAPAVATTAAASSPPGDQATSTPTTTDEKWGQIRPSRWGHAKSSFSTSLCQIRSSQPTSSNYLAHCGIPHNASSRGTERPALRRASARA